MKTDYTIMNKNDFSIYNAFFSTPESKQFLDLQKRFDNDYLKSVVYAGHDFSKESWFRTTISSALNEYFSSLEVLS